MVTEKKEEGSGVGKKDEMNRNRLKKGEGIEEDGLSAEDRALKEKLDLLVERAMDPEAGVQKLALETIRSEMMSATSSMTSVPKPLKFLRVHYPTLVTFFENMDQNLENRGFMADILSVLAMTMAEEGSRDSLKFKLMGSKEAPQRWGHEYVRSLCGEIGQEFLSRTVEQIAPEGGQGDVDATVSDLMELVDEVIPFLISNNAESEACDLLMDVEAISKLMNYVDENNYERICLYLQSCSCYVPEPEDKEMLSVAYDIYRKVNRIPQAMRIALRLFDYPLVMNTWEAADDVRKHLKIPLTSRN